MPHAVLRPLHAGLRRLALVATLAFAAAWAASLFGCARTATAAELQDWGTRTYAGTTKGAAYKASLAAVRSLGYDIAATDNASMIRTAPKVVAVTVVGNQYSAQASSSALAWDLDLSTTSAGVVIHATPRGYVSGQAMDNAQLNAAYIQKAFDTLFGEIERDLGVVPPAPAASASASSAH